MSKNKSSPEGIVCLDYKKTDKLTYENPAFVDNIDNADLESVAVSIPDNTPQVE